MGRTYRVGVIPGDGTGPEVIAEGLKVLRAAAERADIQKYHLRILPRPKNLMEMLEDLLVQSNHINDHPAAFLLDFSNIKLKKLMYRTVSILKILQQEQTLLIMPYEIILF